MAFERFIARRYLLSKKKIQFITIITLISIVGISVGVGALISVLSVFNGFNKFQVTSLTGFDPHVRIEASSGGRMEDYNAVIDKAKAIPEVAGIAPFTMNKAVITSGKSNTFVFIKGVDDKRISEVSNVKEETGAGEFEFKDSENYGGIVLGLSLAGKLGAKVGDTLTVLSTAGMEKALTQIVQPKSLRFIVRGVYDANNRDYDKLYAFISIKYSQRLFDMGSAVSGVDIRLDNIDNSDEVRQKLEKTLGSGYVINTWYDLHKDLYSVMQVERWTAYIILSLIIIVATLTIAGSLTMTVIEKKRDIGVLKAMGASNGSVIRIFMFEGILIGIYGTFIGCLLGLGLCLAQIHFKLFPLDPVVYSPLDALPIDIRWTDFVYVGVASLLLSFIASLYPARRAAKQEPIQAIRWE